MIRSFATLRGSMAVAMAFPVGLLLAAAPRVASAQGSVQPSTQQRPSAQQVVVRRGPATVGQGADTLVQCVPVNAPQKHVAAAKPRRRRRPRPAAAKVVKPTPKPVVGAPVVKRPVVHRVHRVRHTVPATAARRALPALVMCRPIHPVPASQMGPLPETLVPIPQVASAAPTVLPVAPAAPETPPPPFVTASAPHSGWLPLALIPAFFIPFIHSGRPHSPAETPVDTTTPPPPPGPPPLPPPTTVPEPSSLALLATGLVALAGAGGVRRRRVHHTS